MTNRTDRPRLTPERRQRAKELLSEITTIAAQIAETNQQIAAVTARVIAALGTDDE